MRVFQPLANPHIAKLWAALATAAVGDELFKVALVWLAVEAVGERAAYVSAISSLALLTAAALGGRFLDNRDPRSVMISTGIVRSLGVLIPVVVVTSGGSVILGFACAAIIVAGARGQFDPAMQSSLPRLSRSPAELLAINGLADGTVRLARLIGPALAGPLAALIPILHFFTANAVLMTVAWMLLLGLPRLAPREPGPQEMRGLLASVAIVQRTRPLRIMLLASMITNATWIVSITFGLALLVQERQPTFLGVGGIGAYSLLIALYGLSNLTSNIVHASRQTPPSFRRAYVGQGLGGVGMILIGSVITLAPTELLLPGLALACMVIAIGGPMHDLRLLTVIQGSGPTATVSGVFRVRIITQHIGLLCGTLAAPTLLATLGIPRTVFAMGAIQTVATVIAWRRLRRLGLR
ncbi:MAG: MFS transporter [Alphaproteobacteria bacterium]|nr:MFS transporter [Alphaproteobacteria bacterium]